MSLGCPAWASRFFTTRATWKAQTLYKLWLNVLVSMSWPHRASNKYQKKMHKWKTQRDGMEREGGSGWGTHVNPWLIHVNVWQKPLQYCKVISFQWIKINGKKKTTSFCPECRSYPCALTSRLWASLKANSKVSALVKLFGTARVSYES